MAIDKIKIFSIIKIFALTIFLIYFIIYNSKFNLNLPLHSNIEYVGTLKKKLSRKASYALIGGSNVQRGLSGEIISSDSNICINYGMDDEFGGNTRYFNFLKNIVTADVIVYSPMIFWSEDYNFIENDDGNSKNSYFPKYSIANQINAFFHPPKSFIINKYGDLFYYNCNQDFIGCKINSKNFISSNDYIVKEIITRVSKLKEITNTDRVVIRVPPIYASEKDKELYLGIMNKRINLIKNAGITLVGESYVSTDKTLFCDNRHPNEKGRAFFSKEIKDALTIYNINN
jgi:hypothetical protein